MLGHFVTKKKKPCRNCYSHLQITMQAIFLIVLKDRRTRVLGDVPITLADRKRRNFLTKISSGTHKTPVTLLFTTNY